MWLLFFIKLLFFTKWKLPKYYEKYFLLHVKSSFHSRDIPIFVFLSSPLILLVSHCFRGCSKVNIKVNDVINCLKKNLIITHFAWYLEKEESYGIESLSNDSVLNNKHLWKNRAENLHQKLVPDPFLILVNNTKQPWHWRNSFKNKISWKRIIKKP